MPVQPGRWRLPSRQGILWTAILAGALPAFELFNGATTGAKPQRPAAPASTERTCARPARAADAPPAIHRRCQQPVAAQKNSAAAAASAAATRPARGAGEHGISRITR